MTNKSPLRRATLGVTGAFAILLAFELGLRVVGFRFASIEMPIGIWNPDEDKTLEDVNSLHRSNAACLWEPRPLARIPWGRDETVNEATFRGPLLARERKDGVLRVATLGDSSTFGFGVAFPECWSAGIESWAEQDGVRTEILDAGVIGYTVRQGIERYKLRVRPFHPDVVVAAFGSVNEHHRAPGNVDDARKIVLMEERATPLRRSAQWLRAHVRVIHLVDWVRCTLTDAKRKNFAEWMTRQSQLNDSPEQVGAVDWRGQRRVPPAEFASAIEELGREVARDGARLVLVSMPRAPATEEQWPVLAEYSRTLREVADQAGIPLADARAAFLERSRADPSSELFLPGDHWHPSAAGHRLLTECVTPLVLAARR